MSAQAPLSKRLPVLILVFVCVGNDDDVRSVCLTETGVLNGMASGSVLVDHTTVSAEVARELASVAGERGVGFVDAPVSGGQAGAENGQLTIMAGAPPAIISERCRRWIATLALCAGWVRRVPGSSPRW